MAEIKHKQDKQKIPSNSNFSETVAYCIKELKYIDDLTKKINIKKSKTRITDLIAIMSDIDSLLCIISDINILIKSLSREKTDIKIISSALTEIINIFKLILELKLTNRNILDFDIFKTLLNKLTDISLLFIKNKDIKNAINPAKHISVFIGYLSEIAKNISIIILYLPAFALFIANAPILYSSLKLAIDLIIGISEVAKFSLTRYVALKLFGITSKAIIHGVKIILKIINTILRWILRTRFNINKLILLLICIHILKLIINDIRNFKVFFLVYRAKTIRKAVRIIISIINMLARNNKHISKALKTIFLFKLVINSLFGLILSLVILAPISVLFITVSPIIMLCMWTFAKTLNLIGKIISKGLNRKSVRGLRNLSIAVTSLTGTMIGLIVLALLSKFISPNIMSLLITLAGMVVLVFLIKKIAKITKRGLGRKTINNLKNLELAIIALIIISSSILLLSIVSTLSLIGFKNIILFLLGILFITIIIYKIVKIVKKIMTKRLVMSLMQIVGLILLMVGIGYLIIGLSVIATVLMTNWALILMFFVILTLVISAIIILCIVIGKILKKIKKAIPYIIKGLILIISVILILFIIGVLLNKVVDYAITINNHFLDILLFIGGLTMIIIAVGSVGFLAGLAAPILIPAILGLMLVAIIIGILIIIALMLNAILKLNLNTDAIRELVVNIINIVNLIIDDIFNPKDKKNNPSNKSFIVSLIERFANGLMVIVEAIMAIAFLALAFTAILALFLIAVELKLLGEINLDAARIQENIRTIIDTAWITINSIYGPTDDKNNPSDKSFMECIFDAVGLTPLANITKAIFSVAFLALAVISVTLILLLAGELRLLQTINLDANKILQNVASIINVAQTTSNSIYDPVDDKNNPSDKSFMECIFDALGLSVIANIVKAIFSIAFLALAVISVTLLVFLAGELRLLQSINLNADLIKTNVSIIIKTALMVSDSIYNPTDDKNNPSDKSFMKCIFSTLGFDKIAKIIDALFSVAFLALSLISITLVVFLAKQLETLQGVKLNGKVIVNNVESVIKVALMVNKAIYKLDDTDLHPADGLFKKLLRWLMPDLVDILDAITSIGFLASALASVGIICDMAKQLATILGIPDLSGIEAKVQAVIDAAHSVMTAVYNQGGTVAIDTKDELKKYELAIKSLGNVNNMIKSIIGTLNWIQLIAKRWFPELEVIELRIKYIFNVGRYIENQKLDTNKINQKLDAFSKIQKIFKGFELNDKAVENTKHISENCIKFLKTIDGSNLEKLKTAERIFKNMAEFSKSINGNFDALALALNEKIAPLMEELKTLLEKVPNEIKTSSTVITKAIDFNGDKQAKTLTEQLIVDKKVDEGVPMTQAKKEAQTLKQRLDKTNLKDLIEELLEIFLTGKAKVKTI